MNCKPGDLAIVVRSNERRFTNCIGLVIRVTELYRNSRTAKPCWKYEGRSHPGVFGVPVVGFDDDELRPITPPAGTVTDSEVRSLFAPDVEKVVA